MCEVCFCIAPVMPVVGSGRWVCDDTVWLRCSGCYPADVILRMWFGACDPADAIVLIIARIGRSKLKPRRVKRKHATVTGTTECRLSYRATALTPLTPPSPLPFVVIGSATPLMAAELGRSFSHIRCGSIQLPDLLVVPRDVPLSQLLLILRHDLLLLNT
jgi:hypothetical protein